MAENQKILKGASPEQLVYAGILEKGMYLGLLILFVTFAIYVFGLMDPYIPVGELSGYWTMPVHEYLEKANIHPGWGWVGLLGYGDFVNFVGIAMLAGVTIVCYAAIIPTLFRNKDTVYAVIAILEVIVLSAAASGLLAVGH